MSSIASLTPTLCALAGVEPPAGCRAEPFAGLAPGAPVERLLVFAADAVGARLLDAADLERAVVTGHAPLRTEALAALPSVTPVCFATMLTGAPPEAHGLRTYEKRLLGRDSVFDAFARAGKRSALVAVEDSSLDHLFRDREVEHFSERYDPEALDRALSLVEEDRHELLVVYQQEYDDLLHATTPRSPQALAAFRRHVAAFDELARAARTRWAGRPHALAFVSDHGAHVDPETGRGTHGSDQPADLEVAWYWRVEPGED